MILVDWCFCRKLKPGSIIYPLINLVPRDSTLQGIRVLADVLRVFRHPLCPTTSQTFEKLTETDNSVTGDFTSSEETIRCIARYLPMAESSDQSLSGVSHQPRIITRSDLVFVDKSSPREPYISFNTGSHPLHRLIINIWSHDQG